MIKSQQRSPNGRHSRHISGTCRSSSRNSSHATATVAVAVVAVAVETAATRQELGEKSTAFYNYRANCVDIHIIIVKWLKLNIIN